MTASKREMLLRIVGSTLAAFAAVTGTWAAWTCFTPGSFAVRKVRWS
jgi:hypothetical protein